QATGGVNHIETVWGRGYVLRDPVSSDLDQKMAIGA
ncbi:MAG: DNA-binding response regulator, partial [Pseudomonadota bacterium]